MKRKQRWSDFTPRQRMAILAASAVEMVLTAAALADLRRRPAAQVHGSKPLWLLGCFVQPVGPIAYMVFGRRGSPTDQ